WSASALEVALKEKYIDQILFPCKLIRSVNGALENMELTDRSQLYYAITFGDGSWKLAPPFADFRSSLGYLARWAVRQGIIPANRIDWFHHKRSVRNVVAHGHNMIVGPRSSLDTLRQATIMLNQIFP